MEYDPYSYWNSRKNPNKSDNAPPWIIQHVSQFTSGVDRIFELGPGVGRTFDVYPPGQSIVTVDLSKKYAETLRVRAEARGLNLSQHFLSDPADVLPFEDDTFNLGLCLQVLMHVPPKYIAHAMGELARVSRRTVVIAGVNPEWNGSRTVHCFNHDYLRICGEIGCVADAAFIRKNNICLVLRRTRTDQSSQMSDPLIETRNQ
jgi:methyltransferase family protein